MGQQVEVGEQRNLYDKGGKIRDSRTCLGIDTLMSLNTKKFYNTFRGNKQSYT